MTMLLEEEEKFLVRFWESEHGCYSPWHSGSGPYSLVSEQGYGLREMFLQI